MKKPPKRRAIDYANRIEYYCNNLKMHFERKKFIMEAYLEGYYAAKGLYKQKIKEMRKHYSLDMLDYMVNNQVSIPPEYNQLIDEHFCELIK